MPEVGLKRSNSGFASMPKKRVMMAVFWTATGPESFAHWMHYGPILLPVQTLDGPITSPLIVAHN